MSRVKGSKNAKTLRVEETAARLKIDIFETLCLFAKGDWKKLGYEAELYFIEKPDGAVKAGYVISPDMRLRAVESACKYLYTQKRSIDVGEETKEVLKLVIEDFLSK